MRFIEGKLEEATIQVQELLDRVYGPFIEKTVRETNQPALAANLRNLFSKYLVLGYCIKKAKFLDEFESYIEKAARLLERRIAEAQKKIALLAEIEKAKLTEQRAKFSGEFYSLGLENISTINDTELDWDNQEGEEIQQIIKEANEAAEAAFRALHGIFDGLEEFKDKLVSLDQSELQVGLKRFQRWRKIRQIKRSSLRLLWNVLLFGYGFGLIFSGLTKLLAGPSIALLFIIGLVGALLKEYLIAPWLRQKLIIRQRKDLLSSLRDFMIADLRFTILAPLQEGARRQRVSDTVRPIVEEIDKEFSFPT